MTQESQGDQSSKVVEENLYPILAVSAVSLVSLATVVYRLLEDWSWVDSLYFSVVAVTTVGFGDLSPSTDASKLFTILYVLSGVGLVAAFLTARRQHREAKRSRA